MAKPNNSMKTIQTADGVDHEIIPDRLGNNGYVATPPTLSADSTLALSTDIKDATITITQGGTTKGSFTLNQSSNQTIALDAGGGGGGSVDIDNTSITENSSNQIQTVGVIDQKTGNANKQWTGTLAEYNALGTHDANTFYNITDDTESGRILVKDITISTSTTFYDIDGLDIIADGGRYDIEITSPVVSGANVNFWFRLNNKSGGSDYVHSFWYHQGGLSSGSQSIGSSAYIGTIAGDVCWTNGYIILEKANSVPYWDLTNIGYNTSLFYEKFYGYTVNSSNITSLQLISSNVTLKGMHIKIYKRSSV